MAVATVLDGEWTGQSSDMLDMYLQVLFVRKPELEAGRIRGKN